MRVVALGTRGFPNVQGGVEKHCENLYPWLIEKGCEVTVFTRAPYVDASLREYKGVRLIPLACPRNKFLEAFVHTLAGVFAAKRLNPDILHIHAVGPSLFVPLARLLGLKTVMTNHGPDYLRKKWNKFARMILQAGEYAGSRWADAVICISETIAENIRKKYKRDVTVVPNGVVIPEARGGVSAAAGGRDGGSLDILGKYGLEKGQYILAVGRFVPEKGFDDLIAAYEQARAAGFSPRVKLVIAGAADHEDSYSRSLREKAGGNKDIVLTGFITGRLLEELYSGAGLFVLPSSYEGLPIALLEAVSYGLSCIASDIPANREAGLSTDRYFNPRDSKGLALKIRDFMERGCLSAEEKQRQLRIISERYDWGKIADKTLGVYENLKLSGSRRL